jgi:V8-like Glu-specific endopeptidase
MSPTSSALRGLIAALALASAVEAQGFGGTRIADLTPTQIDSPHPYPPSGDPARPVWTHRVSMPQASYLRLHTRMDLGPGDALVVRDSQGAEKWRYTGKGPVTAFTAGVSADEIDHLPLPGLGEEFHTDTVFDDTITLELYAVNGGYGVEIRTVEHGFPWAQIRSITSPETPCTLTPPFLDFECETNATRIANGSAVCGLASGGVFCSGTLISNQSHVLTANHCVSTQSGANTTNLWFRYQELCGTGTLRGTYVVPAPQTFVIGQPSGPGADFTVLRANGTPHVQFGFASLEARDPNPGEALYIVGHPNGRPKEITYGPARGVIGFTGNTHFQHRVDTEGGNSGSAVFSGTTHCIVGVHTNAGCTLGDPSSGNWASRMSQDLAAIRAAAPAVAICGQTSNSTLRCAMNEVLPQSLSTTEGGSSSGFPWGGTTARRTMYAYGGTVLGFDKPVRFDSIEFRPNGGGTVSASATYDFALYVSTSRNPARALDYTFDNNHGADRVKVFDGLLGAVATTLGSSPNPWVLKIPFDVPFEWDPASGPLLLDIQYRSGIVASASWDGSFDTTEDLGRISLAGSSNGPVANFPGGPGNPTQNFGLAVRLCVEADTVPNAYAATEANSSSAFPWSAAGAMRALYAYDATTMAFTGRQRITRLGWRPENGGAFAGATYDVRISMSTGTTAPNALNATFDANHGTDRTFVFDGVWVAPAASASTAPGGFVHSIELTRAFEYNPALGPLVVDIQLRGISGSPGTNFDGPFNTGELVGRVFDTSSAFAATGTTQTFALTLGIGSEPCSTVPTATDNAFGGNFSAFPWGGTTPMRAQYVYDESVIGTSEPIYIQHLRWRPASGSTAIGPLSFDVKIDLSTSGLASASALGTTFDANHGANRRTVHDGWVSVPYQTLSGGVREFPISVKLATPFYYDPAAGPLVVDLVYRGGSGSGFLSCDGPSAGGAYRVVHTSNPSAAVANFGPQNFGYSISLCGTSCNGTAVSYGVACAGTNGVPVNATLGLPTIPNPSFRLRLRNGPTSRPAALWLGLTPVSIDLTGAGANGCFLYNAVDLAALNAFTNALGEASIAAPIPLDPLLSGGIVYSQWVAIDPGVARALPVVTTDGLRLTLCF